jgi:hypothetical protein
MAVQLRIPYGVVGHWHTALDGAGCVVAKGQAGVDVVAGVTKTAAISTIGSYLVAFYLLAPKEAG